MAKENGNNGDGEELDYHISFPSPISQEFSDEEDEEWTPETKEPVVILLGWMGAQDKHLAKYSDFWQQKGCVTIRYTAQTEDIFLKPQKLRTVASKLLELLQDMDLEENPVMIHLFSNGGGFLYRQMVDLLLSDNRFAGIKIIGSVLDSCPSTRDAKIAAEALILSLRVNKIISYMLGAFLILFLYAGTFINWVFQIVVGRDLFPWGGYWDSMENNKGLWPQLFLFSKADEQIPYTHVEHVIECRRQQGVTVHSQCWDDSKHVQHFRVHREAYIQQCTSFLDLCLAQAGKHE